MPGPRSPIISVPHFQFIPVERTLGDLAAEIAARYVSGARFLLSDCTMQLQRLIAIPSSVQFELETHPGSPAGEYPQVQCPEVLC